MADQAAVPIPEEELPEEEQAKEEQDPKGKPKPKGPNVRYGQLLMLGNDTWTVKDGDKDGVTLMRRIGNMLEERRITPEEFDKAKARPLPQQLRAKGSAFFARGLSDGGTIQLPEVLGGTARISGYDAASGDVQVDVPGRGPTWVARNTIQDLVLSDGDREKGIENFAQAIGEESPAKREAREKKVAADRKKKQAEVAASVAQAASPATAAPVTTPGAPLPSTADTAGAQPEIAPETTQVRRRIRRPKAAEPVAPAVRAAPTIRVGQPATAAPSSVSVSRTIPVGTPPPPVTASVEIPQPSIRETRAELRAGQAAAVGTVGASGAGASVAGGVAAFAPPPTAAAAQQRVMYARAANALQVMMGRVASQRGAIQEMQSRAEQLRQTIANLNAQSSSQGGAYRAPADVEVRMQNASRELGEVNNRLAMSRYQLQADDARVQQLQIGTNLMRNAAKETASGELPKTIVALVQRSLPSDIPDPSQERMAALMDSLQAGGSAPEPPPQDEEGVGAGAVLPAPRSFAVAPPPSPEREATNADGSTILAEQTRRKMQGRGLSLPQATAVGFSAAQQAARAGSNFQEGLGAPDARTTAFNTEGAGAQPVISTIPKSYSQDQDITEAEEAADIYDAGRGGTSSEFMRQQQEARAAQEQFLPGTTPSLSGPAFEKETMRPQGIRAEEPFEDDEAARMAAYDAAVQRARAAALAGYAQKKDEEEESVLSATKVIKQTEEVRRNVSRMIDLFNAALAVATVETIIGALWEIFVLLANMNGRLISRIIFRDPKSLARRIFPTAQFPYEFAAIVSMDLIIVAIAFIGFCMLVGPFVIIITLIVMGIGAFAIGVGGS